MKPTKFKRNHSILSRGWLVAVLLVMLLVTGCESLPIEIEIPWLNTPESTEPASEAFSTPSPTPEPGATVTPEPDLDALIIWLPPELNPQNETVAGLMLQEKLDNFAADNSIKIEVRVKSRTGGGSLINSLAATSRAAPQILPDLVVLSAPDLRLASQRDLIFTHEHIAELMNDADWYPFGRTLSLIEGQVNAIPLFTNPLSMVYNQSSLLPPSNDWMDLDENFGIFGFAADDTQAKFLLLLYLSAGGEVIDAQGRAVLEEEPLLTALTALKDGQTSLHISELSITYQTEEQVWTAFLNRSFDTAVVPVSLVLNHEPNGSEQPEPAMTLPVATIGNAMGWALANPDPARQELALELLDELSESEFLASWTEELGLLPARPSALKAWNEEELKPALEQIAQVTRLYPPEDVLNRLGPALRNATLLILRDGADPLETARTTIESIR